MNADASATDVTGVAGVAGANGATAEGTQRGRPRSQKAHKAVLDAAAELLLSRGLSAVSMDEVAERAGVSKATIYRWWPTKETLALDALYTEWAAARSSHRDTGNLRGDLLSLLRPWVRLLTGPRPYGRVVAALLTEAQTDPVFAAEYRRRFVEPRRDYARTVFDRAIDRGEISADTKIEVALDLLYGPIYHRLLHGHAPLNDRFVREVVDMLLSGLLPNEPAASGSSNESPAPPPAASSSASDVSPSSRRARKG
jgi:AcrR family transcriptional regulator